MNALKRDKLRKINMQLKNLISQISKVKEEEEFTFDNIPENLQNSRRGEESQEVIDTLEEIISTLEEVAMELDTIVY